MYDQPHQQPASTAAGVTALLGILLALALLATLLGLAADRTLFSASLFKDTLEEENVYAQVPELLAITAQAGGQSSGFLATLSQQQLTDVYAVLVPQDYIRGQADQLVDSFFAFVNLKAPSLNLTVDLTQVKENLQGDAGQVAVSQWLASLPDCTAGQLLAFAASVLQQGSLDLNALPQCKPPQPYLSLLTPLFTSALQQSAATLPAQITLVDYSAGSSVTTSASPSQAYAIFLFWRKLLAFAPWLAGLLAIMIFLINLRSFKAITAGLGMPLLVASVLAAVSCWVVQLSGPALLASQLSLADLPAFTVVVNTLAGVALGQFVTVGWEISAITLLVGLLLAVLSARSRA